MRVACAILVGAFAVVGCMEQQDLAIQNRGDVTMDESSNEPLSEEAYARMIDQVYEEDAAQRTQPTPSIR